MSTAAGPGPKSIGGRTTRETGEDARTNAGCPAIETWLESASPQKPRPRSSKRSVNEATRGTEAISTEDDVASEGGITAVLTRPGRPAMEAKRTPGVNGATKRALTVALVASLSPLEKLTVTPGVSRPLTSSTASVARSPETICRGRRRIRAPDAAGACCCGRANEQSCATTQIIPRNKPNRKKRRKGMRGIVVENLMPMKAVRWNLRKIGRMKRLGRLTSQAVHLGVQKNAEQLGIDLIVANTELQNIEGAIGGNRPFIGTVRSG